MKKNIFTVIMTILTIGLFVGCLIWTNVTEDAKIRKQVREVYMPYGFTEEQCDELYEASLVHEHALWVFDTLEDGRTVLYAMGGVTQDVVSWTSANPAV